MATDIKKRFAANLKQIIGKQPVIGLGDKGGPSKSYIYRILKGNGNPSLEEMDALLRAYGSSLGDFFASWREDEVVERQKLAAEARTRLARVLDSEANITGLVELLRVLDRDEQQRPNRPK